MDPAMGVYLSLDLEHQQNVVKQSFEQSSVNGYKYVEDNTP